MPAPSADAPFDLDEVLRTLARTPEALRELLDEVSPASAAAAPDGQWSAFDVVGHLIDGEETDWIPRARLILSKGADRRFEPFDRHRHVERNRGKSLDDLVDEFCWLRDANLDAVKSWRLSPGQLALTGEHPEFGTVTLRQLLATWAVHDLGHLAQVARALASRWVDEVGPWRAYLPVLGDVPAWLSGTSEAPGDCFPPSGRPRSGSRGGGSRGGCRRCPGTSSSWRPTPRTTTSSWGSPPSSPWACKAKWLGKHSLFRGPVGWLLRALGGIPVDRARPDGTVEAVLAELQASPTFVLALSPEGTRKHIAHWKTGFYRIAVAADVPVAPVAFDWSTRTIALLPPFRVTGDQAADIAHLRGLYRREMARRPEYFADVHPFRRGGEGHAPVGGLASPGQLVSER